MIAEHDVDCPAAYEAERLVLLDLVRSLDDVRLRTIVPATPAWTVHDVVAHLVGIAADLNAERFPTGDPEAWTAGQIESRRHATVAELAEEWAAQAPAFEDGLRLFGYELGSHYVGDLLQHVQDVRSAVGAGRIADGPALVAGLDHYLHAADEALPVALEVRVEGETHVLGPGAPVATLTTTRFDLFRALGGRRSERQVRALGWKGDVDPALPFLSAYVMPVADLVD